MSEDFDIRLSLDSRKATDIEAALVGCADRFVIIRHTDNHWSFMFLGYYLHVRLNSGRWHWRGRAYRGGNLHTLIRFCANRRQEIFQ